MKTNNSLVLVTMVAMVALVAIVGLVTLINFNRYGMLTSFDSSSNFDSNSNVGGEAYRINPASTYKSSPVSIESTGLYAVEYSSSDERSINALDTITSSNEVVVPEEEVAELNFEPVVYDSDADEGMHVESVSGSSSFTIGQGTFDDAQDDGKDITFSTENEFTFILSEDISFERKIYVGEDATLDCDGHTIDFTKWGTIVTSENAVLKNCFVKKIGYVDMADQLILAQDYSEIHNIKLFSDNDDNQKIPYFLVLTNKAKAYDIDLDTGKNIYGDGYKYPPVARDSLVRMLDSSEIHGFDAASSYTEQFFLSKGESVMIYADSRKDGNIIIDLFDQITYKYNVQGAYLRGNVEMRNIGNYVTLYINESEYNDSEENKVLITDSNFIDFYVLGGNFEIRNSEARQINIRGSNFGTGIIDNVELSPLNDYYSSNVIIDISEGDLSVNDLTVNEGTLSSFIAKGSASILVKNSRFDYADNYGFTGIGNVKVIDSSASHNAAEGFRLLDGAKGTNLDSNYNELGVYVKNAVLEGSSRVTTSMSNLCNNAYDNVDLYVDDGGVVTGHLELDAYTVARGGSVSGATLHKCGSIGMTPVPIYKEYYNPNGGSIN